LPLTVGKWVIAPSVASSVIVLTWESWTVFR